MKHFVDYGCRHSVFKLTKVDLGVHGQCLPNISSILNIGPVLVTYWANFGPIFKLHGKEWLAHPVYKVR